MSKYLQLLKGSYADWTEDEATRLGASLAYYTVLSIAPLLIVVIAVIGLVFGQEAARGQVVEQMRGMVGQDAARSIQEMIQAAQKPKTGTIATILGIITLILAASGVVAELKSSLNKIWEVKAPAASGILGIARERLFSFAMVLAIGFLLLVSLGVSAALAGLGKFFGGFLPAPEAVLHAGNFVLSFIVITALFAMIYKFLPDAKVEWHDVWRGATATALLFVIGKFILGLYLGKAGVASAYGAAGSLVVLLVWVYYSAQIFFFGAEFTQVYANTYGSKIRAENAPEATDKKPHNVPEPKHTEAPARQAGSRVAAAPRPPGKMTAVGGLALAGGILGLRFWNRLSSAMRDRQPLR